MSETYSISPQKNTKRWVILSASLVLLILILLVLWLAVRYQARKNLILPEGLTQVSTNKLPALLPANLPQEAGAIIRDNYNVNTNGVEQGTRRYVTKNTVAQNITLFKQYLQANGWTNIQTQSAGGVELLTATKASETMLISLSQNSVTQENVVDITVTNQSTTPSKNTPTATPAAGQ